MQPSLRALYRRSRYLSTLPVGGEHPSADTIREHQSRERFAAASIGFCLRHDAHFRQAFVKLIFGHKQASTDGIEAHVEDYNWADLLVTTQSGTCVAVLELKIAAKLQPHQNPSNSAFWKEGGYGSAIRDWAQESGYTRKVKYVVLGEERWFKPKSKRELDCLSISWSDFRGALPTNSVVDDLRTTLGELGVRCFRAEQTCDMNLTPTALEAAKLLTLLENVAAAVDLKATRVDSWYDRESNDGHVGRRIPQGRNVQRAKAIGARAELDLGWFGYEADAASVWFYCTPLSFERVKKKLLKSKLGRLQENRAYFDVGFRKPPRAILGDQEWFEQVLSYAFAG
jgi:hypothetical protein